MDGLSRDDIIRIYMQVSDELCGGTEWCWAGVGEPLQRFANLVAAAEREKCVQLCFSISNHNHGDAAGMAAHCGERIRARGQG